VENVVDHRGIVRVRGGHGRVGIGHMIADHLAIPGPGINGDPV
jgi:hypothetical protein